MWVHTWTWCGSKLGRGVGLTLDTVTECGSNLGLSVGPTLDTVWVQPGHGVGRTWTRCGSGHDVGPNLDKVWIQDGSILGPAWIRHLGLRIWMRIQMSSEIPTEAPSQRAQGEKYIAQGTLAAI